MSGPRAARRHAFGIAVDLFDGIAGDGLPAGHDAARLPATAVSVAPPGSIDAGWPAGRARTTRELRAGGRLLFSVAHAAGAGYLLTMPAHGRFLIDEAGLSVRCEAQDAAARDRALAVQALPIACTLRGLEPFHASGAVLGGCALMITGPVTAGKSSLAAALVAGGAELLSDDVVAVDDGLRAHPGGRWLTLRGAEAERPRERLSPAGRVEGRARFAAPLADGPRPLRAVYVLARAAAAPAPIEPLRASGVTLLAATYNLSVRDPRRLRRQLERSHALAAHVPLHRVAVTPEWDTPRLAAAIRAHFEAHAA